MSKITDLIEFEKNNNVPMALRERLAFSFLEIGVHPNILSFFIKLVLFSVGIKFVFSYQFLRSKKLVFIHKTDNMINIGVVGFEFIVWYYV